MASTRCAIPFPPPSHTERTLTRHSTRLQVCIVLSTTYSARLPEEYTEKFQDFSEAVSIDWTALFLPVQCVPFTRRLLTYSLSPVGLIALLLLIGVGMRVKRWLAAVERPRFRDVVRAGVLDLTPPGLVLIFCFAPSVSAFIFRSWSCKAPRSTIDLTTASPSLASPRD